MKHWFLFYSEYYYPAGGMDDFVSAHETYEEAVAAREAHPKKKTDHGFFEIVDILPYMDGPDV